MTLKNFGDSGLTETVLPDPNFDQMPEYKYMKILDRMQPGLSFLDNRIDDFFQNKINDNYSIFLDDMFENVCIPQIKAMVKEEIEEKDKLNVEFADNLFFSTNFDIKQFSFKDESKLEEAIKNKTIEDKESIINKLVLDKHKNTFKQRFIKEQLSKLGISEVFFAPEHEGGKISLDNKMVLFLLEKAGLNLKGLSSDGVSLTIGGIPENTKANLLDVLSGKNPEALHISTHDNLSNAGMTYYLLDKLGVFNDIDENKKIALKKTIDLIKMISTDMYHKFSTRITKNIHNTLYGIVYNNTDISPDSIYNLFVEFPELDASQALELNDEELKEIGDFEVVKNNKKISIRSLSKNVQNFNEQEDAKLRGLIENQSIKINVGDKRYDIIIDYKDQIRNPFSFALRHNCFVLKLFSFNGSVVLVGPETVSGLVPKNSQLEKGMFFRQSEVKETTFNSILNSISLKAIDNEAKKHLQDIGARASDARGLFNKLQLLYKNNGGKDIGPKFDNNQIRKDNKQYKGIVVETGVNKNIIGTKTGTKIGTETKYIIVALSNNHLVKIDLRANQKFKEGNSVSNVGIDELMGQGNSISSFDPNSGLNIILGNDNSHRKLYKGYILIQPKPVTTGLSIAQIKLLETTKRNMGKGPKSAESLK